MKTVLIIAPECASFNRPASTIGAQRAFQFAKNLPKFGWGPIVLCSEFATRYSLNPSEKWQPVIQSMVSQKIQHWDKKEGLIIALPSLRYANWMDRVWMSSVTRDDQGAFQAKPGVLNFIKRKVSTFVKMFKGDYSESWQPCARVAAHEILKSHAVDFILAEHGPDAGFFISKALNRTYRIPWCVDFRDPVLRFQNPFSRWVVKFFYKRMLASASFLMSVHQYWAELDQTDFSKPSIVVTNGYDPDEFSQERAGEPNREPVLKVFYGGNINFRYQTLDVLFQSIRYLNTIDQTVEFTYLGNARAEVEKLAVAFSVKDNVHCFDAVPRDQYLKVLSSADAVLLLSFFDKKERFFKKGLYPGKVFEYFGLRKPIICIPEDHGILDELVRGVSAGESFSDPSALSRHLAEMIKHKRAGKGLPYNPTPGILNYTREKQTAKLAAQMDLTIQTRRT